MINALGNWEQPLSLQDELRLSWHEDMLWWGPTGIGAAYTIERYAQQHAGPFRQVSKIASLMATFVAWLKVSLAGFWVA